ncbi:hypothetical protein BT69DRAFT_1347724 [Atractiella rhizophila]|nr:hypothetical protein BT69DRAFT_1347724 [Atractiella rhizophila]
MDSTKGDAYNLPRQLVQLVVRAFYEAKYVVLIDQLTKKEAMRDEELARRLGMVSKEVSKIAAKLVEDRIIASYRRSELREGAPKAVQKTYYYIDYKTMIDVTKWRMRKILKAIDAKTTTTAEDFVYECSGCSATYSALDFNRLIDVPEGYLCEYCNSPLKDAAGQSEEVGGSKDRKRRFIDQTKNLWEAMKRTDSLQLEPFDVMTWLEINNPMASSVNDKDFVEKQSKKQELKVKIGSEAPADAAKRKRDEEEAYAQRQKNSLPSWLAASTISGDLTTAGAKEAAANAAARGQDRVTVEEKVELTMEEHQEMKDYYANYGVETKGKKREREEEVEDARKKVRFEETTNPSATFRLPETRPASQELPEASVEGVEEGDEDDGRMVTVKGIPMRFVDVTEAELEQMDSDEYSAYFALLEDTQ